MDILLSMASFLEKQGKGTVGENIFVNEMPEFCESGILLFHSVEGLRRHTEIPGYYRGSIMVSTRALDPSEGLGIAQGALKSLEQQGVELEGFKVLMSRPEMLPTSFGTNEGGYVEWLFSVELTVITT